MEAQENEKLNWIERIVGKKPFMMKSSVYREIDLCARVPVFTNEEKNEMLKSYYEDLFNFERDEK